MAGLLALSVTEHQNGSSLTSTQLWHMGYLLRWTPVSEEEGKGTHLFLLWRNWIRWLSTAHGLSAELESWLMGRNGVRMGKVEVGREMGGKTGLKRRFLVGRGSRETHKKVPRQQGYQEASEKQGRKALFWKRGGNSHYLPPKLLHTFGTGFLFHTWVETFSLTGQGQVYLLLPIHNNLAVEGCFPFS